MVSGLLSFLELIWLYSMSLKQIKLTVIDGFPTLILCSNYFFLPFTIRIKRYKDIKEAYVSRRNVLYRGRWYWVYDLILKYSKKSVVLFRGEQTEGTLLEYCQKVNQFLVSFEDCIIFDSKIHKLKTTVLYLLIFGPIILFAAALLGDVNFKNTEYIYCLYGYLITTAITMVFVLLSLMINRSTEYKKQTNVISSVNYIKEKNIEGKK